MAIEQVYGLPGVRAARTAENRRVFRGGLYECLPGGAVISGATSRDPGNTGDVDILRAGLLMGKITTGGEWAPSLLGVTTNAEAIGATTIEAAAGVITELVRRVGSSGTFTLVGPAAAGGAIQTETVTYSAASGTSITATAIVNGYVAGSFIMPTDGSQTPRSFIPDGYGIKVTDQDGTSVDTEWPDVPVAGFIDSSQLVNWPSDVSLQQWIVNRLNDAAFGKFVFDHGYVATA
jgi:hypothetical protein